MDESTVIRKDSGPGLEIRVFGPASRLQGKAFRSIPFAWAGLPLFVVLDYGLVKLVRF